MVNENTTVKELLDEGYDVTIDHQTAHTWQILNKKCPKCNAYLSEIEHHTPCCTECDHGQ